MAMDSCEEKSAKGCHVLIVPFPSQGHVNPCMQLAKKLVRLGLQITVVNTTYIQKRIVMSNGASGTFSEPEIKVVEVSDGLPDDHPRLEDLSSFCTEAIPNIGLELQNLLPRLVMESPIACVIADISMLQPIHGIAKTTGVPLAGFSTQSAIAFHCMYSLPTFIAAGVLPLPPPADPSLFSIDLKSWSLQPPQSEFEAAAMKAPLPDCICLLLNTFYELEGGDIVDAISGHANSNVYAIGPLVYSPRSSSSDENIGNMSDEPSLAEVGSALFVEDPEALLWLDGQAPKSVLYVSFGSMAQASVSQVLQLAYGLEQSQRKFLWVIRLNQVANLTSCKEFSEFSHRVADRSLLVPWVSQAAVLSHRSVGAFLTHCGWNSVIESISSGVPMLGCPVMSDQTTNCFYIAHVWKIGLELEFIEISDESNEGKKRIVVKEEVENKVRKVMAKDGEDPDIDNLRKRCKQLQTSARNAVIKGGSSHKALEDFIKQVTSIKTYRNGKV